MKIIGFGLLIIFTMSCSQTNQIFSTNANRIPSSVNMPKSGFTAGHIGSDLGTIKWSILSEKTFQKIHGKGWVLIDGRCISKACCEKVKEGNPGQKCESKDSDLYSLYKAEMSLYKSTNIEKGKLPDARGQFLRVVNHGISPEKRKALGESHDPDIERKIGSHQVDIVGKHKHVIKGSKLASPRHNNDHLAWSTNDQSHSDTYMKDSGTGIGKETRPKNIAVNVFIKINDN